MDEIKEAIAEVGPPHVHALGAVTPRPTTGAGHLLRLLSGPRPPGYRNWEFLHDFKDRGLDAP